MVVAKGGNYAARFAARHAMLKKQSLKTLAPMQLAAPYILLGMILFAHIVKNS
jgi:hypothetical protein